VRPSKAFQDAIAQGRASLRLIGVSGLLPIEGGVRHGRRRGCYG
jgi:hypothetical protein